MRAILFVVLQAISLYQWVVILAAVFSWLYAFNVVNPRNQFISTIGDMLYRVTEPALRPIRKFIPGLGGIDISPVILLLLLSLITYVIQLYVIPFVP